MLLQICLILLGREPLLLLLEILLGEALLRESLTGEVLGRSTKRTQTNQTDNK